MFQNGKKLAAFETFFRKGKTGEDVFTGLARVFEQYAPKGSPLYAVQADGVLRWYRHAGWSTGGGGETTGVPIGRTGSGTPEPAI